MPRTYVRKKPPPAYTTEDLAQAVSDILNKNKTYREASEHYGIPLGVLHNRCHGKSLINKMGAGRPTDIPKEVEDTLAKCLIARAKMGFPCDKDELKTLVQQFVVANDISARFKDGKPGEDWYSAFMKRNPNLSLKKPEHLQKARKKARDPFVVYHFFETVKGAYEQSFIDQDSGFLIFNADESGFPNDPSRMRGIGEKGRPLSRVSDGSGRDNTTVLACVSASGEVLPPLIVHKGQSVQERWTSSEAYPGTMYAATANGWMEEVTFYSWFTSLFIPFVNKIREKNKSDKKAFLFYDGHASHISIRIIEQAISSNVELIKFPSHLTDRLQPLDKCVFGPVKTEWDKLLVAHGKFKMGCGPSRLKKSEFAKILGQVWRKIKKDNIVKGFQSTGLFPLDDTKFPEDIFDPRDLSRYKLRKANMQQAEPPKLNGNNDPTPPRNLQSMNDAYLPGEIIPSVEGEMLALDLSFRRSDVDAGEGMSSHTSPKKVKDIVDIFSQSITKNTATRSSPAKVATTRLKQHTYGEVLTNDDVLQRLKEAEEKKKKKKEQKCSKISKQKKGKDSGNMKRKINKEMEGVGEDEGVDDLDMKNSGNLKKTTGNIKKPKKSLKEEKVEQMSDTEVSEFEASGSSSGGELIEENDLVEDIDCNELSPNDFVLVQFKDEKKKIFYIGQIQERTNEGLQISYLRRSSKIKDAFIFPVVPDIYVVDDSDIKMKLPNPIKHGQTKRQQSYLSFGVDFNLDIR